MLQLLEPSGVCIMKTANILSLLSFLLSATVLFARTIGKIMGVVSDTKKREKLVSANIIVEGTTIGAATSLDDHRLNISLLGYNNAAHVDDCVIANRSKDVIFTPPHASHTNQEVILLFKGPSCRKKFLRDGWIGSSKSYKTSHRSTLGFLV
jgi:hypothetical protein